MTGMGKVGRNDPCPCGSGRKVKRCCGLQRGPDEDSTARAFLAEVSRDAARVLNVSESQFIAIMEEWSGLATIYPELRVQLPDNSPAIERLAQAYVEMDMHGSREPIHEVREEVDTPAERARLVHAVHALLSEGRTMLVDRGPSPTDGLAEVQARPANGIQTPIGDRRDDKRSVVVTLPKLSQMDGVSGM